MLMSIWNSAKRSQCADLHIIKSSLAALMQLDLLVIARYLLIDHLEDILQLL